MPTDRPLILLANDDGYAAKGINSLIAMVADFGEVLVCAPDGPRSGQSRAFSMDMLTYRTISEEEHCRIYACSGTPVDCVKIAYSELCPRKPSLVLAGINHGNNASVNAQYSATVGIAIEGAMKGIPSIAFSLCDFRPDADFAVLRPLVREIVQEVLRDGLPQGVCLNVNVPVVPQIAGIRYCRMAFGHWRKEVIKCAHPTRNYDYYWMSGYYQNDEPAAEDTDAWALEHGFVAITPLTVDLTAHAYLAAQRQQ